MSLLDAADTLNECRALFNAAKLAVAGCDQEPSIDAGYKTDAVATVLHIAMRKLETAIEIVDQERLGAKAVRS